MTRKQLEQLWKKEYNRIQNELKKLEQQGADITEIPLPRKPKTVTDKSVQRLQKITFDTLSKKVKKTEDAHKVTERAHKVEQPKRKRSAKPEPQEAKRGSVGRQPVVSAEQRRKNLEKARAKLTPEQRRKNLEKARAKLTPEQRKARAQKAAETRRQRELENPELKAKRDEQRRKNLEKAREARREKQGETKTPEEIKKQTASVEKLTPEEITEGSTQTPQSNVGQVDVIEGDQQVYNRDTLEDITEDDLTEWLEDIAPETQVTGIDTENGAISEDLEDIIEYTREQEPYFDEYEPDFEYDRGTYLIDELFAILQDPQSAWLDLVDVAIEALTNKVREAEEENTLDEWLHAVEQRGDIKSVAENIPLGSRAQAEQSLVNFLMLLHGSYSSIPKSVLDSAYGTTDPTLLDRYAVIENASVDTVEDDTRA